MSRQEKLARRIFWAASLFLVPVPLLFFVGDPFVPTMRLAELATVVAITIAVEGPHGVAVQIFALLATHTVLYAGLFWLVARAAARVLARMTPASPGPAALAIVAVGFLLACVFPIYTSPFHARLPETTLLEVYQ